MLNLYISALEVLKVEYIELGMLLGVCPATIRKRDEDGKIRCTRTLGNHR